MEMDFILFYITFLNDIKYFNKLLINIKCKLNINSSTKIK